MEGRGGERRERSGKRKLACLEKRDIGKNIENVGDGEVQRHS